MNTWKAILLTIACTGIVMWACLVIMQAYIKNQEKWEDRKYHRLKFNKPNKHSFCGKCGRPRPHKKMIWDDKSKEWWCDEHVGL